MTITEERLRAALQAKAAQVQPADLRPADPPATRRWRAPRRLTATAALVAAAAATVGVLVAPRLLPVTSSGGADPAARPVTTATSVAPLAVTFADRTRTLTPPGATATYPAARVTGGTSEIAQQVTAALGAQVEAMITTFADQVEDAPPVNPQQLFSTVTAAETVYWNHYLSVRLDQVSGLGGPYPDTRSTAVVIDTRTGRRVLPAELVTDPERVMTLIRTALVASRTDGSVQPDVLADLTLTPGPSGSASPLTCYPTPAGLRCLVDQGSVAPHVIGQIDATVPWAQLTGLLRTDG